MTIKARIDNGIVAEIYDSGDADFPPFNPELIWVDCTSQVQVGWSYDGTTFSPPPGPSAAELWSAYQRQAMALLVANDTVAIRCVKASVAYPADWLACDVALRAIVHATSGDPTIPLPAQPITRPAGT